MDAHAPSQQGGTLAQAVLAVHDMPNSADSSIIIRLHDLHDWSWNKDQILD